MDNNPPQRVAAGRRQPAGVGGEERGQMALPGIGEADTDPDSVSASDGDGDCRLPCGESVLCWCRFIDGGIRRTVVYKPARLREDYHIGSDMVSLGRRRCVQLWSVWLAVLSGKWLSGVTLPEKAILSRSSCTMRMEISLAKLELLPKFSNRHTTRHGRHVLN